MQSRFWLATFNVYEEAFKAKQKFQEEFPDRSYQIRKGTEGKGYVFRVVERLDRKEAEIVNETKQSNLYKRRRGKKPRKSKNPATIL